MGVRRVTGAGGCARRQARAAQSQQHHASSRRLRELRRPMCCLKSQSNRFEIQTHRALPLPPRSCHRVSPGRWSSGPGSRSPVLIAIGIRIRFEFKHDKEWNAGNRTCARGVRLSKKRARKLGGQAGEGWSSRERGGGGVAWASHAQSVAQARDPQGPTGTGSCWGFRFKVSGKDCSSGRRSDPDE